METKMQLTPMECIEKIYEFSQDSHLRQPFFDKLSTEIKYLSTYLHCSEIEAVIFAVAFVKYYDEDNYIFIFKHLGLNEFHILKFKNEIANLNDAGLLINKENKKSFRRNKRNSNEFDFYQDIINAIVDNKPIVPIKKEQKPTEITLVDLLEEFDAQSDLFDSEIITFYDFQSYIIRLCRENEDRPLFKEIQRLKLDDFETYFLLDTIWDAVSNGDNDFNTFVQSTVNDYYTSRSRVMTKIKEVIEGKTLLTEKHLIELSRNQFGSSVKAKLSDRMIDFLAQNEALKIDNFTAENKKLVISEKLPLRSLFYNRKEEKDILHLSKMLQNEKFNVLQERLKEKNIPFGVSILLHGEPGTGKTESVYQLAKQTGRNIYKVDISETKSMWFGESQKIIKKVFSDYQEFCKSEKNIPILLFNEADAIIGKRKEAGSSNVADTENAIQNIILEEMENFEGIMFATTNLVTNMDTAFERRFLFKIKFEKPEIEVSAKIWKSKLNFLTESQCMKLANQFPFSGGEMENIARKCTMHEILENESIDFQKVLNLCESEKWETKSNSKIGF